MKKNLAIVLALVLVLCATVALADAYVTVPAGSIVIGGHYIQTANQQHIYVVKSDAATGTNMACVFKAVGDPVVTTEVVKSNTNADAHEVITTSTQKGVCAQCGAEMAALVTKTHKAVAHTLVRGAYKGFKETAILCHNDTTHLTGYDVYEAVCSVCGTDTEDYVPVYEAHKFQTKNPTGVDSTGKATYGKGSTCHLCDYTRVYKDLTTAAGQKVEAIIAAYEAAGKTVEFDADQMIAVGIEEGEVAEVEGCGVATIQFSNWTPVSKYNTNEVVTDEEAKADTSKLVYNYTDKKGTADEAKKTAQTATSVKEKQSYVAENKIAVKKTDKADVVITGMTTVEGTVKEKNINQDTKSYDAAFVTMYVDGEAHRVYFYNRHDKAGWVYAFEADMAEGTYKVGALDYANSDYTTKANAARVARCGAGQEYATVGSYFVGTELNTIGTAYATEGYNTTWKWAMVDDFEFVCIGK